MGRSVTYQFTKSTPAVSAPWSRLRVHAQRVRTVECQETPEITQVEQTERGCCSVSSENVQGFEGREGGREQISGECLLVGAGWLSVRRHALHQGPRRPKQQVLWLRWEIFLTLVMSDETHTNNTGGERETHTCTQTHTLTALRQHSQLFLSCLFLFFSTVLWNWRHWSGLRIIPVYYKLGLIFIVLATIQL